MVWRASACVLLVVAGGCDFIFRIDRLPAVTDDAARNDTQSPDDAREHDASIDSAADAMLATPCTPAAVDDQFTGSTPCMGWGTKFSTLTNVTSGGGKLKVEPMSDNSDGGCNSNMYVFANNGIIVHMTSVISGNDAYNGLQVRGTNLDASVQVNNGTVFFETSNAMTVWASAIYMPAQMAWLRLRPDRAAGDMVAETSADGAAWNQLGRQPMSVPQMAYGVLIGGVNPNSVYNTSTFTTFTRFLICQ